jgi:NTP pyrophosphatase (non-canonical NTP hydrolase)
MYYIYHIFGKKIGVTRNLNNRVTSQQGYKEDEYEVLETSDDIDYVSDRELELQSIYGYKVDRQSYKNLTQKKSNQMQLNVTEQTTTFPCPINKLKGNLIENKGMKFKTNFGNYYLNDELIEWIIKNANTSMFNPARSYVYNKAMHEAFEVVKEELPEKVPNVYDLIRQWADERGIYRNGDAKTQFIKLQEETGELARAILKNNQEELIDAIGDAVVVLTNLAALEGLKIEDCVKSAYDVIKLRQGSMVNGTFVKENPSIIPQTTFNTNPSNYQLTKTL